MAALDLVTAAALPSTVRDAVEAERLPLFITAVSESLAAYCRYPLHRRVGVVESAVGQGGMYLWLRSGAIRQVTSVEVRGQARAPSSYAIESAMQGRLVARGEPWPFTGTWTTGVAPTPLNAQDTGEVLVTFDAGWVTPGQHAADASLPVDLPASIQLAAQQCLAAFVHVDGQPGDLASESIGAASVSYLTGPNGERMAIPATARQLLARYRKAAPS